MPHPSQYLFGINPKRRRFALVVLTKMVAYKGKRGVTKILLRMLIKKIVVRALAKTLAPWVSPFVNAMWNGITVYNSIIDCKYIALGPSFVDAMLAAILAELDTHH